MARPRLVSDPKKVRKIVDEYCELEKPTKAKLLMMLGITQRTMYTYLSHEDEIAELIQEALLYLTHKHEERLYDRNAAGSIFFLKTLRKFIDFKEHNPLNNDDGDIKLTIKVREK